MRKIINYNEEKELAFPDGIYQYVYSNLFLHTIHISIGFYCNMYLCSTGAIIILMTSINYWKKPVITSFARKIDMICVFIIVSYHYYLSFYTTNKIVSSGMMTIGILNYPLSIYFHNIQYIKTSALCHCLLHTFVSIGCSFMYYNYYIEQNGCKWNINC